MDYSTLPESLDVGGRSYAIRYHYRVIIDVINILNNQDFKEAEKYFGALKAFYVDFAKMPVRCYPEAIQQCYDFISYGSHNDDNSPSLMSWEQDLKYILSPISKSVGVDVRSIKYDMDTNTGGLHWWTFLSHYMEMGDCLFAQILKVREKLRKGTLDATEREWYHKNQNMVDLHNIYTAEDDALLAEWT